MYFNKIRNPVNFSFPSVDSGDTSPQSPQASSFKIKNTKYQMNVAHAGEDVYRVTVDCPPLWSGITSQTELRYDFSGGDGTAVSLGAAGEIKITDAGGETLLATLPNKAFGVSGAAWLVQFEPTAGMHFYGMGEKNVPFER